MTPTRVALLGVSGRMGRSLVHAIHEGTDYELAGALASADSPALGADAGEVAGLGRRLGVLVTADRASALASADVALDFTVAAAVGANLAACVARGCALLIGTTGLDGVLKAAIDAAAARIALVEAPNTSLGVNLLAQLVAQAAASLPPEYDIEILEAHHRYKVDAPSGTALHIGGIIADALGRKLDDCAVYGREGVTGERKAATIGFATVRGGDIVGEHTVMFAGPGERVEIVVRSNSRATYAQGALRAARFLTGKKSGLFDMQDVLGLR